MASLTRGMKMREDEFVSLLSDLIGKSEHLQNNPPGLIPSEDLVVDRLLKVLEPLSTKYNGPLVLTCAAYTPGRSNLIVEYPGTESDRVVSVVGCHMDVVMADASKWDAGHKPFQLTVDGDKLYGRGTTDCLGHVALVTQLMKQLAEAKPKLKTTVVAVFIANEENSSVTGIGVDGLMEHGLLDKLKLGPLYWMDCSDKQPCIGTGGMLVWHLTAEGKLAHSGLPNQGINALELASVALEEIQDRFYKDFPPREEEKTYKFTVPSTMKPTQWSYPEGAVNQIPGECTITGDCRMTPFYKINDVEAKIRAYVADINANVEKLKTRGPASKYVLPDGTRGMLRVEFNPEKLNGIACNLDSPGYKALEKATKEVLGKADPFSITGSLPLVADLQDAGYDVQNIGYGLTSVYHAENEYCLLSDMSQGFKVFAILIADLDSGSYM